MKGGGFNTDLAGTVDIAQTPFRDEHLYAYEAGTKIEAFDRKVRLNLSGFYYDYRHFQGFALVGVGSLVANYNGYFTGGEAETMIRPGAGITITGGVAYLRTKLHDVQTAYAGIRDQQSIEAPHWTVNGIVAKDVDLSSAAKLRLQWDANYLGTRYASVDNNPATRLASSFVHNARVTLNLAGPQLELSAFVNNISDVDRQTFVYDLTTAGGFQVRAYAPPRTWGVSARKSF